MILEFDKLEMFFIRRLTVTTTCNPSSSQNGAPFILANLYTMFVFVVAFTQAPAQSLFSLLFFHSVSIWLTQIRAQLNEYTCVFINDNWPLLTKFNQNTYFPRFRCFHHTLTELTTRIHCPA